MNILQLTLPDNTAIFVNSDLITSFKYKGSETWISFEKGNKVQVIESVEDVFDLIKSGRIRTLNERVRSVAAAVLDNAKQS